MYNGRLISEGLIGKQFGKLTILKLTDRDKYHHQKVLCKCLCGNLKEVRYSLLGRNTSSCGCLIKDVDYNLIKNKRNKKHGLYKHPLYKMMWYMKQYCYSKNTNSYRYSNKKRIIICDEWKNDFQSFYNWCLANGWKEGLSIRRINKNGNYEPNNCKFVNKRKVFNRDN